MILSSLHLKNLRANVIIKAQFPGVPVITEQVVLSSLPAIFGIPKLLIGSGVYNSADEGATLSVSPIWDDDSCWIGVTAEGDDLAAPCVGRTMQWDAFGGTGLEWELYTEKQTKTDIWQVEHWTDEKIFDAYFGHRLIIDT